MTSVEDLLRCLAALDEYAGTMRARLEYEASEVRSTRDRVQGSFGDQQAGHHAAMYLDTAMGQLLEAEGAMRGLRENTRVAVAKLRS